MLTVIAPSLKYRWSGLESPETGKALQERVERNPDPDEPAAAGPGKRHRLFILSDLAERRQKRRGSPGMLSKSTLHLLDLTGICEARIARRENATPARCQAAELDRSNSTCWNRSRRLHV